MWTPQAAGANRDWKLGVHSSSVERDVALIGVHRGEGPDGDPVDRLIFWAVVAVIALFFVLVIVARLT